MIRTMALGSTTSSSSFAGNGSTVTPYTVGFRFDAPADLVVTVTDSDGNVTTLADGVDYTLAGDGQTITATFTTATAYDATNTVECVRNNDQRQNYTPSAPLDLDDLENAIDRVAMSAQDNRRDVDAQASHAPRTDNPHEVTEGQVGLGSVDNTADVDKPVSTAQQAALDAKADTSSLGAAASIGTSTGGNGGSDSGKALIFDVDGGLSATKSVSEEITCDFRATGTGGTAVRGWAQGSDSVGGLFQTDQTGGAGLIGRSTAAGAKCFIARGDADHLTIAHDGTVTLSSATLGSLVTTLAGSTLKTEMGLVVGTDVQAQGTVVTTTPTSGANVTSTAYVDQTQHMTPAASQTFITLALPSAANARVGQIVRFISTTEDIGNVTVATSGGAGTITPAFTNTTLTAFDVLAYQCISTSGNGSWIRIQ